MEQVCKIVGNASQYVGVVVVEVPSIYGHKTLLLPKRMAMLISSAARALVEVYTEVVRAGGHLYISDMFRSSEEQDKAHDDWVKGRKAAYSPPSCSSMHEAARAIDIDAFDTGIGHAAVRKILVGHGWTPITSSLTGSECWHYEYRIGLEDHLGAKDIHEVARIAKLSINNASSAEKADEYKDRVRWIQASLNTILPPQLHDDFEYVQSPIILAVDGIYGERTREWVKTFQRIYGLQVDGVVGPRTEAAIRKAMVEYAN
jgi:peptidoglycan hydrolase-like protein with peptidoglycan-binding domain